MGSPALAGAPETCLEEVNVDTSESPEVIQKLKFWPNSLMSNGLKPQIKGGIEGRDKGYYLFCVEDLKAQTRHLGVSPTWEAMRQES